MAAGWEVLKQATVGSNTTTFDSGTFTAKKYLKVVFKGIAHTNYGENLTVRFNGDTGSNYNWQYKHASTNSSGSGSYSRVGADSTTHDCHTILDIVNISARKKLVNWRHQTVRDDSESDGTPKRVEGITVWNNTSAQITSVQFGFEFSGSRPVKAGCMMTVWGADDAPVTPVYPNLTNGTIFEESDTGKHYMFDGTDTWNEVT